MLGVMLLILRITGLLLLGILGLLFALVLVVLFFPVSYHVWVQGDSREPGKLSCRVKLLGVQVFPKKERKKKAQKPKGKKQAKAKQDKKCEKTDTSDAGEIKTGNAPAVESQTKPQDQAEKDAKLPQDAQISGNQRAQAEGDKKKKQTETEKHLESSKRHKNSSDKNVRGMLQQLWSEVTDEGNRRALGHVCSEIKYFLRHFGPRRVEADVSFSMGDPANTGYVTASMSLCPFPYEKNCEVIPDFDADHFYLCGWINVRGHVRTVHVLFAGLRLLFDKNIRRIIRKILKKKR